MHKTIIPYTTGDPSSIQQAVEEAVKGRAKYILFPDHDQNMDIIEIKIQEILQDHASDITVIGGGGINNVDRATHYSYTRVYATSSTGPLAETDSLARNFIQQRFSKPSFVKTLPSHLWVPKDLILAYDFDTQEIEGYNVVVPLNF
jgi:hypothetical protein